MNDLADPSILFRAVLGALGCALFYTAMCRLKHMTKEATLARFRFAAVALLAAGAVLVLAATVRPDWIQLAAVSGPAAALAWMIATSHAWRESQPLSATRGGRVLRRKRLAVVTGRPRWDETVPMTERERRRMAGG